MRHTLKDGSTEDICDYECKGAWWPCHLDAGHFGPHEHRPARKLLLAALKAMSNGTGADLGDETRALDD